MYCRIMLACGLRQKCKVLEIVSLAIKGLDPIIASLNDMVRVTGYTGASGPRHLAGQTILRELILERPSKSGERRISPA